MRSLEKWSGAGTEGRLSCQAIVGKDELVVEIPKYTINLAKESQ